jgi:hypothetical protein
LHGETRRTGPLNLHGPGNDRHNIIIADSKLNAQMNTAVERHAIMRVYSLNQTLWYEANVDEYFPGAEFFARKINVTYGIYNPKTGLQGPPLDFSPFTFVSEEAAPPALCSFSLPSAAPVADASQADPTGTPKFASTIELSKRLNSREFSVERGGLVVTVSADWELKPDDSAAAVPPTGEYSVTLAERDPLFDDDLGTVIITVGSSASAEWKQLDEDDDYFLIFAVSRESPSWILRGTVSVAEFDAPRRLEGVTYA